MSAVLRVATGIRVPWPGFRGAPHRSGVQRVEPWQGASGGGRGVALLRHGGGAPESAVPRVGAGIRVPWLGFRGAPRRSGVQRVEPRVPPPAETGWRCCVTGGGAPESAVLRVAAGIPVPWLGFVLRR